MQFVDRAGRQVVTPVPGVPWASVHEPAANTAAVVTKAAPGVGLAHYLGIISGSFGVAAPTAGTTISVTDGGTTIWKVAMPATLGSFHFGFATPIVASANAALAVTVAAPGGTSTAILAVAGFTAPAI